MIVVAPFRFTEVEVYKARPVLVVSNPEAYGGTGALIVAMITGAQQSEWPLDVAIRDWQSIGLTKPCCVRMKLATVDLGTVGATIGALDQATFAIVQRHLCGIFGC